MARTNLLLVVTGSSRGLGRAIATEFNRASNHKGDDIQNMVTLLVARSVEGLETTQRLIVEQQQDKGSTSVTRRVVERHVMDLSDLDQLDKNLDQVFQSLTVHQRRLQNEDTSARETSTTQLIFVNNAGSLGHLGPCWRSPSLAEMKRIVDFNVTSALWCSVRFAQFVRDATGTKDHDDLVSIEKTTIVNISSLAAVQPLPSMGIYSAGKAARDMYHGCFAKEYEHNSQESSPEFSSEIKILNYAPGPLETDMATELRSAEDLDKSLKPNFAQQLVDPNASAQALIPLVLEGTFASGAHIDFYDLQSKE